MTDNSNERKRDSSPEGCVIDKLCQILGYLSLYTAPLNHQPKGNRRRKRSSSSISSRLKSPRKKYQHPYTLLSSSSLSSSSGSKSRTPASRRFKIIIEEKFQYGIAGDMAKHVNQNLDCFLSDRDLKKNTIQENPVAKKC